MGNITRVEWRVGLRIPINSVPHGTWLVGHLMPANEDEQLEPSHHHSLSDSEKLHSHTVLHPLIAQWALSLQNNTKPKRRVIENFFHKTWHKFLSNDKMLFLKYFRNDGIRKELLHSGKKLLKKRILKFFCFCTIFQFLAYHCVILLTMEWMMLWIFHVVPSPNILSISSFSNRDSGFVQMLLPHQSKRFDGKIVLTWLIDIFGTDWRKHVFVTPS